MSIQSQGIYDARSLGTPKMLILGLQHLFAMFGATVLVPIITGLNVSTTLLFAGLATLFMHFVTQRKVPVFLGSSFAFLGGYEIVKQAAVSFHQRRCDALHIADIVVHRVDVINSEIENDSRRFSFRTFFVNLLDQTSVSLALKPVESLSALADK